MKPESRHNRGKRRGSNPPTATPQPTPQRLRLTMGPPPARPQVPTPSTSVDDPFRRRLFVPDRASQTPTPKSLDTQQFEQQRNQFTRYNELKRAAAGSLSELARRRAPEGLFTTAQEVETSKDFDIEVSSDESYHSSDNLSELPTSAHQSRSQSRSRSESQIQPETHEITETQTQTQTQTQSKARRQRQHRSQTRSRPTKKPAKEHRKPKSLTPSDEEPPDVSYILNTKVFFEASLIYEHTDTRTVSGIQQVFLLEWNDRTDARTKRWADDKGWSCHRIEIKATVTWGTMKATERRASTLEVSFQPVQRILEHQIESKQKGLAVDLVYRYGRNIDGSIPLPNAESLLSQAAATTTGTKKAMTATNKLVADMEQRAAAQGTTADSMTALTARHVCKSKKCINFDRYCWVNKDDQIHYKLSSGNFVGWNDAINKNHGDGSMDRPPSFIVESLYRLKKAERKDEKASSANKNPFGGITGESPNHPASIYPGYPPVPPFASYPYYPPAPAQPQPTDSLIAILALKEKKQMEREEREDQERRPSRNMSSYHHVPTSFRSEAELRSSPVQEDLKEYIQWHIRRQPRKSTAFNDAFEKLDTAGYDVEAIQTWKGDAYEHKWRDLDIPTGIGLQLARDASKFHKENMKKTLDEPQSLSMRLSPRRQKTTDCLPYTWTPPPYAHRSESQMETQDENGDEDDIDSTQLFQTIEGDSGNNLEYDNEGGISDLDDIDPTQSQ